MCVLLATRTVLTSRCVCGLVLCLIIGQHRVLLYQCCAELICAAIRVVRSWALLRGYSHAQACMDDMGQDGWSCVMGEAGWHSTQAPVPQQRSHQQKVVSGRMHGAMYLMKPPCALRLHRNQCPLPTNSTCRCKARHAGCPCPHLPTLTHDHATVGCPLNHETRVRLTHLAAVLC